MAGENEHEIMRQSGPRIIVYEVFATSDKFDVMAELCELPAASLMLGPVILVYMFYEKRSVNNFLAGNPDRLRRRLDRESQFSGTLDAMIHVGLVRLHQPGAHPDYPDGCVEFVNYVETVGMTYKGYCLRAAEGGRAKKPRKSTQPAKVQRGLTSPASNPLLKDGSDRIRTEQDMSGHTPLPPSGEIRECVSAEENLHEGIPGGLNPTFETLAFQRFYKSHRRPSRRREAWQEWLVLFGAGEDPILIRTIMESLAAWNESEQWKGRGAIRAPDRWLADRPWEHPPPPPFGSTAAASEKSVSEVLAELREEKAQRDAEERP